MLNTRLAQLLLGALLSIALVGLLPTFMFWLDLNAFEKQQLNHILMPRLPLMLVLGAVGLAVPVLFFGRFYHRHLHSLERVNHRLREALQADGQALALDSELSPEEHTLLSNTNALMATVQERRSTLDRELMNSSSTRLREKTRLTALLNQLTQGVLVCNLEGRILLANGVARSLLSDTRRNDTLGESIFALFEAELIAHALTIVRERLTSDTHAPHTTLSASTRSGHLVRLRLAIAVSEGNEIEGFVITLDDIDSLHALNNERDKLLHGLNRETRNLLTRLRTGIDSLQRDTTAQPHQRTLLAALGRDTARHCKHLERLSFQRAEQLAPSWPLEAILASDLYSAIRQRLLRAYQLQPTFHANTAHNLWLEADSFSLVQSIANCVAALQSEWEIDDLALSNYVDRQHQLLLINIKWQTGELRQEDFRSLATSTRQRMAVGGRALVELIERHGGRAWLTEPESSGQQLSIALPLCAAPSGAEQDQCITSNFDFSEAADNTAQQPADGLLQHQYFTVITVGSKRNSAADRAGGESTLTALLLAGGKPQALAQKKLHNATLSQHGSSQSVQVLGDFSRKGMFIAHDADQLLAQLSSVDRQLVSRAGLLDTGDLARLLFPEQKSSSLYHVAARLGLDANVDNSSDQVKLVARVFNRMLTRLQSKGIHSYSQLQQALATQTESPS